MDFLWSLIVGGVLGALAGAFWVKMFLVALSEISLRVLLVHG